MTRRGYLFFGAPNERSTAQPERDFYIYMLQPFDPPKFKDEEKPDEVFFKLDTNDEEFHQALRLFAGAREMALTALSSKKHLYEEKAAEYLQKVNRWLRANMVHAFKITYKGKTKRLSEWSFSAPAMSTVREIVMTAADECLSTWFLQDGIGQQQEALEAIPHGSHPCRVQTGLDRERLRDDCVGWRLVAGKCPLRR